MNAEMDASPAQQRLVELENLARDLVEALEKNVCGFVASGSNIEIEANAFYLREAVLKRG